jgi:hypothetical protein
LKRLLLKSFKSINIAIQMNRLPSLNKANSISQCSDKKGGTGKIGIGKPMKEDMARIHSFNKTVHFAIFVKKMSNIWIVQRKGKIKSKIKKLKELHLFRLGAFLEALLAELEGKGKTDSLRINDCNLKIVNHYIIVFKQGSYLGYDWCL